MEGQHFLLLVTVKRLTRTEVYCDKGTLTLLNDITGTSAFNACPADYMRSRGCKIVGLHMTRHRSDFVQRIRLITEELHTPQRLLFLPFHNFKLSITDQ
jgi:hypothetical protein